MSTPSQGQEPLLATPAQTDCLDKDVAEELRGLMAMPS